MKEYTVTYNVQITEILTGDEELEKQLRAREKDIADSMKHGMGVDDVVVSDYKVFVRDTKEFVEGNDK